MHKPGDNSHKDLVFPDINPDFIDSQLEVTKGIPTGVHDITAHRVNTTLETPLDKFLNILEIKDLTIVQIFAILEGFDEIHGLIQKYSSHWRKIKNMLHDATKMKLLLAESVMQNIENRPGYQQVGFDPDYLKILFFLQRKYEKLP